MVLRLGDTRRGGPLVQFRFRRALPRSAFWAICAALVLATALTTLALGGGRPPAGVEVAQGPQDHPAFVAPAAPPSPAREVRSAKRSIELYRGLGTWVD